MNSEKSRDKIRNRWSSEQNWHFIKLHFLKNSENTETTFTKISYPVFFCLYVKKKLGCRKIKRNMKRHVESKKKVIWLSGELDTFLVANIFVVINYIFILVIKNSFQFCEFISAKVSPRTSFRGNSEKLEVKIKRFVNEPSMTLSRTCDYDSRLARNLRNIVLIAARWFSTTNVTLLNRSSGHPVALQWKKTQNLFKNRKYLNRVEKKKKLVKFLDQQIIFKVRDSPSRSFDWIFFHFYPSKYCKIPGQPYF